MPYHLVDYIEVDQIYNSSLFVKDAKAAEAKIRAAGRTPIFAGGTGMYLQAYFSGMDSLPQADGAIRAELAAYAEKHGKAALHEQLTQVDPQSAAEIPAGNIHRVIRAIEIYRLTGKTASSQRTGKFNTQIAQDNFFIYLDWEKEALHKRIIQRTNNMFNGMCAETEALLKQGYTRETPALKSLGYAQIIDFIEGKLKREEALERIIILTRQYAKRQRTWFMRYAGIKVINAAAINPQAIADEIKKIL
ncbi:tRNA dimethylallyltransferase [Elusimicrobium posterum]